MDQAFGCLARFGAAVAQLFAASILLCGSVHAQGYSYTCVAEGYPYRYLGTPRVSPSGNVVFGARTIFGKEEIRLRDASGVTVVLDSDEDPRVSDDVFVNDAGAVVFRSAVFPIETILIEGGVVTTIDAGFPGGIDQDGAIVYRDSGTILVHSGGVSNPIASGNFPKIRNGRVAYETSSGLFRVPATGGPATQIVDFVAAEIQGTPSPGGIDPNGFVAFLARVGSNSASTVQIGDGNELFVVISDDTFVGNRNRFGYVAVNGSRDVGFLDLSELAIQVVEGGEPGGPPRRVVGTGDELPGGTIIQAPILGGIDDAGRVAFWTRLYPSYRDAIYIADPAGGVSVGCPPPTPEPSVLAETTASPDAGISVDGVATADEDAVVVGAAPTALADLGALPAQANLMAYHREDGGDQLFVLDPAVTLPGVGNVEPRDVVRWDGTAYSVALAGSTFGIPAGARIDALSQAENGDLVVSFDAPLVLGGVAAEDEDLLRLESGGPTLLFDGSAARVPANLDVDAVHYLRARQDLLLSFGGSGIIDGVFFDDQDVLEYDADDDTWLLSLRAIDQDPAWGPVDLDAFHAVRSCAELGGDTDGDLLCDVEDPCSVYANALPVVDTNGDGIPDECQCADADENGFLQFQDAFLLAECAGAAKCAELDITIAEADNNGFFGFADAFAAAAAASGSTFNPPYALRCARRPDGIPAPPPLP